MPSVTKRAARKPSRSAGSSTDRRSLGRYSLTNARQPANGIADPPKSKSVSTAIVAVPDPNGDHPHERSLARVNIKVDLLETERAHGRISDEAYVIGRQLQSAFERMARGPGASAVWKYGTRINGAGETDGAVRGLEVAEEAERFLGRLRELVGVVGERQLRRLLTGETTFQSEAVNVGRNGERGTSAAANRFRWTLEAVAEEWTSR